MTQSSSSRTATVYARLMDRATLGLMQEVEQRLASDASKAARSATGWVHEQLRAAYLAGVQDGFAQGVAAAEED